MSKSRKYTLLSLFALSAVTMGISSYLYVHGETISNQVYAEYNDFVKANSLVIGNEAHLNEKNEKKAAQLLYEAFNNKDLNKSAIFQNSGIIGFGLSIILFLAGLLTVTYNSLKKATR
jgi:hypothetical protein